MYRLGVHNRKGTPMFAISAIDCALWDLRGKYVNQPVHRLLGGPTRETMPAYASMLGHSLEPDKVEQRAQGVRRAGVHRAEVVPALGAEPTGARACARTSS